jgi:exopolysaccharide biosynthesis polyprenyl glycosylphosphotransferase
MNPTPARSSVVGSATAALVKPGVAALATILLATELLGQERASATGVVVTWWALMFAAAPGRLPDPTVAAPPVLVRPAVILLLLCWAASFSAGVPSGPRELVLLGLATVVVTALVELGAALLRRAGHGRTRAARLVVVGSAGQVLDAATEIARPRSPRWQVVGACLSVHARAGDSVVELDMPTTDTSRVAELARSVDAAGVLVLPTAGLSAVELRRLSWELERDGRHFLLDTGLLDVDRRRTAVLREGGLDVVHVRPAVRRGAAPAVKAVLDRLGSAVLILLLAPLMLAVAVWIRLDSAGPALFTQVRVGRDGRAFTIYKFRTMTTDAEAVKQALAVENESDAVLFKIRRDPRITRAGRVLRKYSLDELPQLFNVALGQMSLVGPRPALPQEVSAYDHDPRRRLAVKPGITGLWQVSGRSDLSWEETVRRDVEYVDNWSMALDLAILWRTIGAVVLHRGAY